MNSDQVNDIVGTPYGEGSFGPDSFNCWGLLHYVQRHYFYRILPVVPIGNADECAAIFGENVRAGSWERLAKPEHGCGALMREGVEPHVGVYLDCDGGGILHSVRGAGVIWTPAHLLQKAGYGKTSYYRFN